ncbi:hypothetical protein [Celerinatantimonas sp. YJH-8]|uniref:hypothetical protein n=1 Tax=Celerinatantimonas sp. YJH-8 TaxID=3228714 RepID=UPI0038C58DCE
MGLFGGSSHSSSNSTQNTTTYNLASDGDNNGVMVGGTSNTVTLTDHDAVAQSMKLAQAAMDSAEESADNVMNYGQSALNTVQGGFNSNLQSLETIQARQTNTNAQQLNLLKSLAQSQSSGGGSDLLATVKEMMLFFGVLVAVVIIFVAWRMS